MKKSNVRLAFLASLAGLIYLLSFIFTALNTKDYFNQLVENLGVVVDEKTGNSYEEKETIKLYLKLKENSTSFPDTITNLKTGVMMRAGLDLITVRYNSMENTKASKGNSIAKLFISMLFLYVFIAIPVIFYKLIISIYQNDIFNKKNIKRINRMGILYLLGYFSLILTYYLELMRIRTLIELNNYDITIGPVLDSTSGILLLGIVLFIIGNVMRRAIRLKEEQDLTI